MSEFQRNSTSRFNRVVVEEKGSETRVKSGQPPPTYWWMAGSEETGSASVPQQCCCTGSTLRCLL